MQLSSVIRHPYMCQRWVNAETFHDLKVVPQVGKAILFYNRLPDGNLDDFSQHAALPVTKGEKVRFITKHGWNFQLYLTQYLFFVLVASDNHSG